MFRNGTKDLDLTEEDIISLISYLLLAIEVCREKMWGECVEELETFIARFEALLSSSPGNPDG